VDEKESERRENLEKELRCENGDSAGGNDVCGGERAGLNGGDYESRVDRYP